MLMSLAEPEIIPRRDTYRFGNGSEPSLQPGTVGWSINDLQDPAIRSLWDEERYEILDGVLTVMPPAFFRGGSVVDNLKFILRGYFRASKIPVEFSGEVDIAFTTDRVIRADGVVIAAEDLPKFNSLQFDPPRSDWRDHELILPPTIAIESVSNLQISPGWRFRFKRFGNNSNRVSHRRSVLTNRWGNLIQDIS